MPTLQRLQVAMPELSVVPIDTGRSSIEGIKKFYETAQVTDLPLLCDPDGTLAHQLGGVVHKSSGPQGTAVTIRAGTGAKSN